MKAVSFLLKYFLIEFSLKIFVFCNFLLVVPDQVKIDHFFQNDEQVRCNGTRHVQWQPINTGSCSVEYTIEFRNSKIITIGVVESITGNFYCTSDYDNAILVIVWATYESKQGLKSEPALLTTRRTTNTTTTITTTIITPPITTNIFTGKMETGIKVFISVCMYICMYVSLYVRR